MKKKAIVGFILLLVLTIAAALYYVLTNLDAIVRAAIEKAGSRVTQTAVRVDNVEIKLTDGAAAIRGLTVANPPGFAIPHAVSLREISTEIDLNSVTKDPIVIDDITIRAVEVFYEMNAGLKDNLNALKENIAASKPSQPAQPRKEEKPVGKEPRLIIRRARFSEGAINAKVVPLQNREYNLKLPAIDMRNLGGESGATGSEIAEEILNRVTDRALAMIKQQVLDRNVEQLKAMANERVGAEKAKLKQEVDTRLEAEKQRAEEKLKGLLKR